MTLIANQVKQEHPQRASLAGKRILVTRPRAQAADLCDKLAALGAEPILFPTIEIAPMEDNSALDRAIRGLDAYQWIIFTSVNGVSIFWDRLVALGVDPTPGLKFAAIGPATAQALSKHAVHVEFIPDEYIAERLLEGVGEVEGQWILLPRAEIARTLLADALGQRGAIVHEIAAYHTLPAAPDPQGLADLQRGVDVITFTSSSTVRNFVALVGSFDNLRHPPAIACIGPITAQTAREAGLPVDVVAGEYTMDGLVAALADYYSQGLA